MKKPKPAGVASRDQGDGRVVVAGWDGLQELLNAELQQRAYEGALVPAALREQIATLTEGDVDVNEERARPLFEALASLDLDPAFPFVQPNDLAGIRRERPDGPRQLEVDLSDDELLDRFHGAWSGRASGCALGKPVERLGLVGAGGVNGRRAIRAYLEHRNDWPLTDYFRGTDAGDGMQLVFPASQREHIAYMEPDDDIQYTLIALHVLETTGPGFAWFDVAEAWNDCLPYGLIFTAESQAILNYNIATPRAQALFGNAVVRPEAAWTRTNSNPYREWIGGQIRADGWGYACAGNPELAAELAWRDASWTHTANGIYAAMFTAAVIAAAFVESDPIRLAEIGLSEIPRACRLAEAVADAFSWFPACPTADDFMERLEIRFHDLNPVHAVNNALIVLMALVYGAMETHKSICLAVMAGLDTDCNGATVGSIVGAAAGRERFDSPLLGPLQDTVKARVLGFQDTTMRDLAVRQLGVYRAVQAYTRPNGRVAGSARDRGLAGTGRATPHRTRVPPTTASGGVQVAGIRLNAINKTFAGVAAVKDVSLELNDGEFLVLVGPSGCGKTTLLRMIAGLEPVTSGTIFIGDRDVTELPPKQRDIAMVFQDYALYPHMTVEQNLGIGLKLRRVPRGERAKRVRDVAELLGLAALLKRKPGQLSGGQQQRVAIGRAMVREPVVYLLDEPLSNLDAQLRAHTRAELARLRDRLRVTTVYVTHDQIEAMTLGDRVAVLRDGVLQQVATPRDLFEFPDNAFVAGFIGSPEMNLVHAEAVDGRVRFGGHDLPLPDEISATSGRIILGIRPSKFSRLGPGAPPGTPRMEVTVDVIELLGEEMRVMFPVDAPSGAALGSVPSTAGQPGVTAELLEPTGAAAGHRQTVFTASLAPDADILSGKRLTLAVDTSALYFFDAKTGRAIRRSGPHDSNAQPGTPAAET